jgi:hypothetical protein
VITVKLLFHVHRVLVKTLARVLTLQIFQVTLALVRRHTLVIIVRRKNHVKQQRLARTVVLVLTLEIFLRTPAVASPDSPVLIAKLRFHVLRILVLTVMHQLHALTLAICRLLHVLAPTISSALPVKL